MSSLPKKEDFDRIHQTGLYGIITNYDYKKDTRVLLFSIFLSASLTSLATFLGDLLAILNIILDMLFSTVPTIIGFLVAGFALMFGFGDRFFLQNASQIKKGTSLYLDNVRAFSYALVVLIVTQFLMFIFEVLSEIPSPFEGNVLLAGRATVIFILLFFGFYSLFLLYHAVKNVYNLTIGHHGFLLLEPFTRKENDSKSDPEE